MSLYELVSREELICHSSTDSKDCNPVSKYGTNSASQEVSCSSPCSQQTAINDQLERSCKKKISSGTKSQRGVNILRIINKSTSVWIGDILRGKILKKM